MRALLLILALAAACAAPEPGLPPDGAIDLSRYVDCAGAHDATAGVARALADGAGRAIHVPAGCRALVGGPAPGAAAFTVASGTSIRCENHEAGFTLARRHCAGGPAPGAACDDDAGCPGGACTTEVAGGPFAPQADATYTLLRAAAGARDVAIVGCGIFVNQLEPWGRCAGGRDDGAPCGAGRACAGTHPCTGEPRSPAGPGKIVVVDLSQGVDGTIDDVRVADHLRGTSFRGGSLIERSRNDVYTVKERAALTSFRADLDAAVEVTTTATVHLNTLVASGSGVLAAAHAVHVSDNRIRGAGGEFRPEHPTVGVRVAGAQSVITGNDIRTFNCIRGTSRASNVTVSGNRCFGGKGTKVVIAGPGWIVVGNYLAWGTGEPKCVGGPRAHHRCGREIDCPEGFCPLGAPVIAVGEDGVAGWTDGGGVAVGVDHAIIADNLLFSQAPASPGIAFANPGLRCVAGAVLGAPCDASGRCACTTSRECGRFGPCTRGVCENPLACKAVAFSNGSIVGNVFLGRSRVGIDLSRIGAGTAVTNWNVAANDFQGQDVAIRLPSGAGADGIRDLHVAANAYSGVRERIADWDHRMGTRDDEARGTIVLENRTGATGTPGDVVAIAADADRGFVLATSGTTAIGVLADAPEPAARGRVAVTGTLACNLEPGARVARGDRLGPGTTPGKGRRTGDGEPAYAVALSASGDGDRVECLLR